MPPPAQKLKKSPGRIGLKFISKHFAIICYYSNMCLSDVLEKNKEVGKMKQTRETSLCLRLVSDREGLLGI